MASDPPEGRARRGVSRRGFLLGAGTSAAAAAAVTSGIVGLGAAEAKAPAQAAAELGRATVRLRVNGVPQSVDVEHRWTLLEVLRDKLGLTGTKLGCDRAECGACTVLMDGVAVYACSQLAMFADGAEVTTIEGLARGDELHPIQEAFAELDGGQCNYCIPGQIMAAKALLDSNSAPTMGEIRVGMSGNLCRCANYNHIQAAVLAASRRLRGEVAP
jgi:xanthine dehydrogenase YagT iron-sulfur-binding subunit